MVQINKKFTCTLSEGTAALWQIRVPLSEDFYKERRLRLASIQFHNSIRERPSTKKMSQFDTPFAHQVRLHTAAICELGLLEGVSPYSGGPVSAPLPPFLGRTGVILL